MFSIFETEKGGVNDRNIELGAEVAKTQKRSKIATRIKEKVDSRPEFK